MGREPWEWAAYEDAPRGVEECDECQGSGEVEDRTPVYIDGEGMVPGEWADIPCRACRGRGWCCKNCGRPEGLCEHTRRVKQPQVQ